MKCLIKLNLQFLVLLTKALFKHQKMYTVKINQHKYLNIVTRPLKTETLRSRKVAMKSHGRCRCIFTAKALGGVPVASPTLDRLYPQVNRPPVHISQEVEWTSGPDCTRRSEEKSPPGIEPGPSSPLPSALPLKPPGPHL